MAANIEDIIARLKEIIDRNGPDYLADKPYEVYKELKRNGNGETDKKIAGAILYFLVNGLLEEAREKSDQASLSKTIQSRCCLNKKMADMLAAIFLSLYSQDHKEEWKEKELEGLTQFLQEEFECTWEGFAVWDAGNGTVDCHYEAEIVLLPKALAAKDDKLVQMFKKNPFMKQEDIEKYFEKKLFEHLDNEFQYYCTCDDYYQPVVEDFELRYYVEEWCKKNGFEIEVCEGNGEDSGYEPKFRRGGW